MTTQQGFVLLLQVPGQELPSAAPVLADNLQTLMAELPGHALPGKLLGVLPLAMLEGLAADVRALAAAQGVELSDGTLSAR